MEVKDFKREKLKPRPSVSGLFVHKTGSEDSITCHVEVHQYE